MENKTNQTKVTIYITMRWQQDCLTIMRLENIHKLNEIMEEYPVAPAHAKRISYAVSRRSSSVIPEMQ